MFFKSKLALLMAFALVGCEGANDAEYGKLMKTPPKWVEMEKSEYFSTYIDSSRDGEKKKSPFIRFKTVRHESLETNAINIYRLDCENHRYANYFTQITQKPTSSNKDYGDHTSEYSIDSGSESYYYNPTQPNSVNRLWRTFPVGDNLVSNYCKLKDTDVKPPNPKMPEWTYSEQLSKLNNQTAYFKTDEFKALKEKGEGAVTIKSFETSPYEENSSSELKMKIDCKNKDFKATELIVRNFDFEYAPATDQSLFSYKNLYKVDTKPETKGVSGQLNPRIPILDEVFCK